VYDRVYDVDPKPRRAQGFGATKEVAKLMNAQRFRLSCVVLAAPLASASFRAALGQDGLAAIRDPSAEVRKVAGDSKFTEGPAWSPQGFLVFSDIPNDRIVKVLADGTASDFLKPSGKANGLMFDRAGRLYACQGGERRVVRLDIGPGGELKTTVLAESFEGKKLNSPNDLAVDAGGGVYFTDPRYGDTKDMEQPVMGVYYAAGGEVRRVIDDLQRPNGILVSPDGKRLYVAEPNRRQVLGYDIAAPGRLSGKIVVYTGDAELDGGGPDGMAHDEAGRIYATYKSIVVLEPDGKLVGRIAVPEHPANCEIGGPEGKTLFITARTSLYAVDLKVRGMALQPAAGEAAAGKSTSGAAPAAGATRKVKAGALELTVPATWREGKVTSSMRAAQFEVPAVEGDREAAELVVFYFGEGGAGQVQANVERWIGQFVPEAREVKVLAAKDPKLEYHIVDLKGTYLKPVGPPVRGKTELMAGARMLGAIVKTPKGPYYLKLTGPRATVSAAAAAFRAAFGGSESSEKAVEIEDLGE
jgi:gluconolactonase